MTNSAGTGQAGDSVDAAVLGQDPAGALQDEEPVDAGAPTDAIIDAGQPQESSVDAELAADQPSLPRDTFYVDGAYLKDRCGKPVILRGVNEMVLWSTDRTGNPEFAEIAKSGANAVRIVWDRELPQAELAVVFDHAVAEGMVPLVVTQTGTDSFANLLEYVEYWTHPAAVDVITRHEAALLLCVADALGDDQVTAEEWEAGYVDAIGRLRAAGIRIPIVVDAPDGGQNIDVLQSSGERLIESDPLQSIMLSVHMWWEDGTAERIHAEVAETVSLGLPLIVGEFSAYADDSCPDIPFDYRALLEAAAARRVGWFAWSWGGVPNGACTDPVVGTSYLDMSVDGTFEGLAGWGLEVAVTDPYSIQQTAIPVQSLVSPSCE